ncbi:hypothetical protein AK812_SmicGene44548 [Symbiodinium microadriaticum]|uniref:Uncharacterized protein n=1 Tax=Symbiodinium microadriaticum TaxID=2951 RepID=A0A1Q9BY69_SYMMI|nr:hypothetical protein AK812_SmicGene44548 [Symbiodinium microadriaticum]
MAKAFPGTQKDMSHSLALLRKGLVVLCFRKQQHEAQAAWQSEALDSILCEDVATAGPAALYMHVGYVNFRTWDMSVLQLEEVSSENEDGLRELSAGLPGAPLKSAQTVPQLLSTHIDFHAAYTVSFWEVVADAAKLLSTDRMLGRIVEVKKHDQAEDVEIWKGSACEAADQEKAARYPAK